LEVPDLTGEPFEGENQQVWKIHSGQNRGHSPDDLVEGRSNKALKGQLADTGNRKRNITRKKPMKEKR